MFDQKKIHQNAKSTISNFVQHDNLTVLTREMTLQIKAGTSKTRPLTGFYP